MKTKTFPFFILFFFYLFSYSFAEDYNFKFHKLKINSYSEINPLKIGKIRGKIDEYPLIDFK